MQNYSFNTSGLEFAAINPAFAAYLGPDVNMPPDQLGEDDAGPCTGCEYGCPPGYYCACNGCQLINDGGSGGNGGTNSGGGDCKPNGYSCIGPGECCGVCSQGTCKEGSGNSSGNPYEGLPNGTPCGTNGKVCNEQCIPGQEICHEIYKDPWAGKTLTGVPDKGDPYENQWYKNLVPCPPAYQGFEQAGITVQCYNYCYDHHEWIPKINPNDGTLYSEDTITGTYCWYCEEGPTWVNCVAPPDKGPIYYQPGKFGQDSTDLDSDGGWKQAGTDIPPDQAHWDYETCINKAYSNNDSCMGQCPEPLDYGSDGLSDSEIDDWNWDVWNCWDHCSTEFDVEKTICNLMKSKTNQSSPKPGTPKPPKNTDMDKVPPIQGSSEHPEWESGAKGQIPGVVGSGATISLNCLICQQKNVQNYLKPCQKACDENPTLLTTAEKDTCKGNCFCGDYKKGVIECSLPGQPCWGNTTWTKDVAKKCSASGKFKIACLPKGVITFEPWTCCGGWDPTTQKCT